MNELPKQEEDALRTWLQQAREPEISHDELVAYLRCQTNHELTQKIESVKTGNANIRLLFDLIDQERDKAKVKTSQPKGLNYPRIPRKVEALLQQISAGQSSRKDAQQFIDGLTFSPLFYRQVLRRIAVALAEPEGDEEIEKLPATVRNEILRTVLSDAKPGNQGGFLAVTSRTASDIWQDIRRLPDLIVSPKAGFMAAAAMVVFVSLFGVRYYQTTYNLNQAAELLRENYLVYYSEVPRLSGGYGSTGISMLLGDEPEDNPYAYLDEAAKLTRQAADKGADPLRTKQLGAQVELIKVLTPALHAEGDPFAADSVLSQVNIETIQEPTVLNDLGVLRFTQKRWQNARAFFQRTIAAEPEFKEAYYNLALTEDRMNNTQAAQKAITQYLQLEEDEAWRRAARHFLQNL